MTTAKVVYASMTGNTENVANYVNDELNAAGVESEVNECTEVEPAEFKDVDICVVASYTYGEGELPDEIADFYEDLEETDLKGKIYGVVGSGDTSYDDLFCKAVDLFEEAFEKTGAKKGAEGVRVEFSPEDDDKEALSAFVKQLVEAAK
jgi:flavodoxin short chain